MTFTNEALTDFTVSENVDAYRAALSEVRSRLGADYPLTIGGEKHETGDWIESHNPGRTTELVGRSARGGPPEIDRALAAAWEAFRSWSARSMEDRIDLVRRLADVMRSRRFELAAWMTFEAGKNFAEADADVAEAIDFCEYYAHQAPGLAGEHETYPSPGESNTSMLVPLGAGAVISPWNFPLAIFTGMAVGPAVVGNTLVLKPSPDTPIVAQMFIECAEAAGFPPGVFNLVAGADADIGDYLVDHARTRFINFTGSLTTGIRINQRAATVHPGQLWIKKVGLEMGGKDALIVDETADLDYAARMAVASGYGFGGQKCSAMSRLIAVESIHDELVDRFVALAEELEVGPADENPDFSALINERARDKSLHYIDIGNETATMLAGGAPGPDGGHYVAPTVFADVSPDSKLAQEEIFGPVVSIIRARDFDDALGIANGTMFGLTGGLISNDRARLDRAKREFEVGNLYLNRKITGAFVGLQPFGGLRLSGTTVKAGGPYYLRQYLAEKTIAEKL
ncbi:MAG: L-glutamate gamma-semialdehyde dehydrogenase [Acidimicrobiia bacterium]|nr:L-glutamate gamma-semialdehyde dehydrogenase [Acidimicrobiia bacterium]NNL97061.1 L-glutamate gamma-semialdehyde dehydrogenase [Acidimicrobiia bacterium]